MRNFTRLRILTSLIFLIGIHSLAHAATFTVTNTSNDVLMSGSLPWAINEANITPGLDIVSIPIGGTVAMTTTMFITEDIFIDAGNGTPDWFITKDGGNIFQANGVTDIHIKGIDMSDVVGFDNNTNGIDFDNCHQVRIENCRFDNLRNAIDLNGGSGAQIDGNAFVSSGIFNVPGVILIDIETNATTSNRVDFSGNTMTGGNGLRLQGMDGITVGTAGSDEVEIAATFFNTIEATPLDIIACDDVTIDGIDFSRTDGSMGTSGFTARDCSNLTFQNNTINNHQTGATFFRIDTLLVHNNGFEKIVPTAPFAREAILIDEGSNATVTNNSMTVFGQVGSTFALRLDNIDSGSNGKRMDVRGNTFINCGEGVLIREMDDVIVDEVLVPGTTEVHLPDNDGRWSCYATNLRFELCRNLVLEDMDLSRDTVANTTQGQGLELSDCHNALVQNLEINNRLTGINVFRSDTITIHNNNIERVADSGNSREAILVNEGSNVTITNNNMILHGLVNNTMALSLDNIGFGSNGERMNVRGNTFTNCNEVLKIREMDDVIIDEVDIPGTTEIHFPDNNGRKTSFATILRAELCRNLVVEDFEFTNDTLNNTIAGEALEIDNCDNAIVQNNAVYDKSNGFIFTNCDTLLVHNNTFEIVGAGNSRTAISIQNGSNATVTNNEMDRYGYVNNGMALFMDNIGFGSNGKRLDVRGNTFVNGGENVRLRSMDNLIIDQTLNVGVTEVHLPNTDGRKNSIFTNIRLELCDNTSIQNFDLSYDGGGLSGDGIELEGCINVNVSNNTITNRDRGIHSNNSSQVVINTNTITNTNNEAIQVRGGSNAEVRNNILTNTVTNGNDFIFSIEIDNVSNDGTRRIAVAGNTFNGGRDAMYFRSMDNIINSPTYTAGVTEVQLSPTDGREGMDGHNLRFDLSGNTTLDGYDFTSSGAGNLGIYLNSCDSFFLNDITINNASTAIRIDNGSDYFISNSNFSDFASNVFSISNANGLTITGNDIRNSNVGGNNSAAIRLQNVETSPNSGHRLLMEDNKFSNHLNAIMFRVMDDIIVSDGTVANSHVILDTQDSLWTSEQPLYFIQSHNAQVENITIKANPNNPGEGSGIVIDDSDNATINNVSVSNKGNGLNFIKSFGNTVQNSLLQENVNGLYGNGIINDSTTVTVSNTNIVCNSSFGINANNNTTITAASNFWGANDGSSTDSGSGDSYREGTVTNQEGSVVNSTNFLINENALIPVSGRKIYGNGAQLSSGQTAVSTGNNTDFGTINTGTSLTKMFAIQNNGLDTLFIDTITSDNTVFTIANAPAYVLCEDSVFFDVTFAPTAGPNETATIDIEAEDCYNTSFIFNVQGAGNVLCDIAISGISVTDEGCPDGGDGALDVTATCTTCSTIEYSTDSSSWSVNNMFIGLNDGMYTVFVRDSSNHTCNASMMVTIAEGVDSTPPTIACNDITVSLDNSGAYTLTPSDLAALASGSSDNCTTEGALTITSTPSSFDCNDVAGQANNLALSFDQTPTGNGSDYVVSSNNVGITGNADRTLEFWIRMDETDVFNETIINWGDIAQGESFGFYQTFNSELEFYTFDSPNGWDHGTGHFFDEQQWYHIAVSYDGSTNLATIYINGDPAPNSTFTPPGTINTTDSPLFLATRTDLNALTFTSIDLDEVRVWDYARTQSEIMADMNIALNGNESGLVLYYDMELDGTGTTNLVDKVGSNDATLINMDPANDWIASGSPVFSGGTPVVLEVTDAAGNTSTSTCAVSVTVNTNLTVASTAVAETCMDNDDGQLTITVTGGTGPYTFTATRQGDGSTLTLSGTSPQTFMNLIADEYIIEVEDNGECSGTTTASVGASATPCCDIAISGVSVTDEVCPGADDGALDVTASCTTCSTIEYSTDSSSWVVGNMISGLADGMYTVYVRDSSDHTCNASSAGHVVSAGDTTDTDSDNVPDCIDLDDDNDGILDVDELVCDSAAIVSSTPVTITETFGAGTDPGPAITEISNSYTYSTGPTSDGFYSIATDTDPYDDFGAANNVWSETHGVGDNTGDNNGYFLLINGSAPGQEAFRKTFNIVPNSDFTVSVALINLGPALTIKPNLTLRLENSNGVQLDMSNTGNLLNNSWATYTLTGMTSADDQVDLVIISNAPAGSGNDYGVDDVSITYLPLLCDRDEDNISDSQELDSDNDGCFDVAEAGYNDPDDDGILGTSPVSVDTLGRVLGEGGYTGATNEDAVNPMAICQDITVYLDGSGMASITASDVDGGSSDNCGGVTLSIDSTNFNCSKLGANTVVLTAEDGNGNINTCNATVTVVDSIAPTAVCQDVTVYLDGSGMASITAAVVNNGSSDNCGSVSVSIDSTSFDCSKLGANTVVLTASDGTNMATCSATVTVLDTIAPVITCPANITVSNSPGICEGTSVNLVEPTITDNCGPATISFTGAVTTDPFYVGSRSGNAFISFNEQGDTTKVASIPSANGVAFLDSETALVTSFGGGSLFQVDLTTSAQTTLFTVPVVNSRGLHGITIDVDGRVLIVNEGAQQVLRYDVNTSQLDTLVTGLSRPVQVAVETDSTLFITEYNSGKILRYNKNTDLLSDFASGFNLPTDMFIEANGDIIVAENGGSVSRVTNGVRSVFITPGGGPGPHGIAKDDDGNIYVSVFSANVIKKYSPSGVDLNENISVSQPVYIARNPNNIFTQGSTTITWEVEDMSGNTSLCTQTVTVVDTEAPTAVCQNLTLNLNGSAMASITANDIDNGSADNCSAVTLSITSGQTSFGCADVGNSFTVTLRATDATGNIDSCFATVTITDTNSACCDISITSVTPTDENCPGANDGALTAVASCTSCSTIEYSTDSTAWSASNMFSDLADGNYTVYVRDSSDYTCNASMMATIAAGVDTTPPTAVCQDVTVYLDGSGMASITASDVDGGSSDNCGGVTLSIDSTSFDCSKLGANTVVLTATDGTNMATCSATVTVLDNTAPLLANLPSDITISCTDALPANTVTASDNCSEVLGSNSNILVDYSDTGWKYMNLTDTNNDCDLPVGMETAGFDDSAWPVGGGGFSDDIPFQACGGFPAATPFNLNTKMVLRREVTLPAGASGMHIKATYDNGFRAWVNGTPVVDCIFLGGCNYDRDRTVVVVPDNLLLTGSNTIVIMGFDEGFAAYLDATITLSSSISGLVPFSETSADGEVANEISIIERSWAVVDGSGNQSTHSQKITILDNIDPTATCPANTVNLYLDGSGNATLAANSLGDGSSSDNCGTVTESNAAASFTCNDLGAQTVILTADDGNGNTDTENCTVMVIDSIAPIAACTDITINLVDENTYNLSQANIDAIGVNSTDNCGTPTYSITAGQTAYDCADVGNTYTVTLRATDTAGHIDSCTAMITITDTNSVCCDISITSVTPTNEGCPNADDGALNVTASCTSCSTVEYSTDSTTWVSGNVFSGLADGMYTVYVRDSSSHICNASMMAVIGIGIDTTPPSITSCPSTLNLFATPAICTLDSADVDLGTLVADDMCGIASITHNGPAVFEVGDTTITWTVTDNNGIMTTCTQLVTVYRPGEIQGNGIDDDCDGDIDEAPLVELIELENGTGSGSCVSGTDECADTYCYGLQYTPNLSGDLSSYTAGFITQCTDGSSSVITNASCVMNDNSNELVNCANGGVLFNSNGNQGAVSITEGTPIILHQICFDVPANDSIEIIKDFITNITMTITIPNSGLTYTETPIFDTLTVTGNTAPMITVGSINACYTDNLDAEIDALAATTSVDDYSAMNEITYTATTVGTCNTVIRVYAADACGLMDSVDYPTTIDGDAPVIAGALDISVVEGCDTLVLPVALNSASDLEALPGGMTITDACTADVDLVVSYSQSISGSCPIIILRNYTITDACGNMSSLNHTIHIDDTSNPTINGTIHPASVEGCTAADAPVAETTVAGIETLAGNIEINDACHDSLLTVSHTDFVVPGCTITITRIYTITDACGNSTPTVQIITITDSTAPELTVGTIDACYASAMEATMAAIDSTTYNENCAGDLTYTTNVIGTCPSTIQVIGADVCGNLDTVEYTTQINDGNGPTEVGGPAVTSSMIQSDLDASPVDAPMFEDNCGNLLTPTGPVLGGTYQAGACEGTITYAYTYTDCAGTDSTWTYTYFVECQKVNVKVYLHGPYDASGDTMTTNLTYHHQLPGQDKLLSPQFAIKLGGLNTPFGHPYAAQPWGYNGTLGDTYGDASAPNAPAGVTPYPSHVVDWVLITVRENGIAPSNDVWQCAGWLHNNGKVTYPDGCPTTLAIDNSADYYVVVEHRNHMAVLDTATIVNAGDYIDIDFTVNNSYAPFFRYGQTALPGGLYGMYQANGEQGNSRQAINDNDVTVWRIDQPNFGYLRGDFNLDAVTLPIDETNWKLNQGRTTGIQF